MVDSPSGRTPTTAPRWDLADTEGYGGGNISSVAPSMFSGYVGLYRRKKYVGGHPRGPRNRGACPGRVGASSYPVDTSAASWLALQVLRIKFVPKSRSRRFHSVWTLSDILLPRNTEIGKKQQFWAGPPVNRLVPKII